jgi:penicillin G amidase
MWKWLRRGLVFLFIALLLSAGVIYHGLRGSLAQLDGEAGLPGLEAAVEIERDAQGVPTLSAGNRLDLARATGYLHAQERYFQMDLTRRGAAGELSELIGPATLERDRKVRLHRMRSRAAATLALASATPCPSNTGCSAPRRAPGRRRTAFCAWRRCGSCSPTRTPAATPRWG